MPEVDGNCSGRFPSLMIRSICLVVLGRFKKWNREKGFYEVSFNSNNPNRRRKLVFNVTALQDRRTIVSGSRFLEFQFLRKKKEKRKRKCNLHLESKQIIWTNCDNCLVPGIKHPVATLEHVS